MSHPDTLTPTEATAIRNRLARLDPRTYPPETPLAHLRLLSTSALRDLIAYGRHPHTELATLEYEARQAAAAIRARSAHRELA